MGHFHPGGSLSLPAGVRSARTARVLRDGGLSPISRRAENRLAAPTPSTTMTEPIPISAIEHWSYCPRQCALIYLESVWDENLFTLRGSSAHERVDEPEVRFERGKRIERALPVWSEELGITGRCDVVEFDPEGNPYPVEFKSGRERPHPHAELQLCAQALCLESITGKPVPEGALFFLASRARVAVPFTPELRARTREAISAIQHLLEQARNPPPVDDARCRDCSLAEACKPDALTKLATHPTDLFTPLPESNNL